VEGQRPREVDDGRSVTPLTTLSPLRRLDDYFFIRHLQIYQSEIRRELSGGWQSLLDVGCGRGSPLAGDEVLDRIPVKVGIDGHEPDLAHSQQFGPYDTYVHGDILSIEDRFGPNSFDVVMALDVIEHLTKDDGWKLLDKLEAVARRRVVVFTPNGFLRQGEREGNPLQLHRSGWTLMDFEERGYRVVGINGLRYLRGEQWVPRVRPAQIGGRISAATQPLVTRRPRLAFQLLAVLDLPL
jgi:SAM-dependent methyltransferase